MTFCSELDTLDLFRSSANVLNPGGGESSAGLGKGSVIPNLALTASDRAVTSGSSDPDRSLAKSSAVRSRAYGWALGEEDPDSFQEPLKLSAGLDAMLSGARVLLVVSVVILCPPCL